MSLRLQDSLAMRYLLVLTTAFFLNISTRLVFVPLMPVAQAELQLHHVDSGVFFLLLALGYSFSLFASGFVSARLTHRWTICLSSITTGFTLLFIGHSNSVLQMQFGLLITGLATGLYLPSGVAVVTAIVHRDHWGKAIAIHELAPNLGSVLVPLLAEAWLARLPWRGLLVALGLLCLAAGSATGLLRSQSAHRNTATTLGSLRYVIAQPTVWVMAMLFGLASGANFGIYSMLPLYLVTYAGFERLQANSLIALSRIPGVVVGLAVGFIADRLGIARTLRIILASAGAFTVLVGITTNTWLPILVIIQATLVTSFFPLGFAILSRLAPYHLRHVTISLVVPIAILVGNGATPTVLGWLSDWGQFSLGIVVLGGLLASSSATLRRAHQQMSADQEG